FHLTPRHIAAKREDVAKSCECAFTAIAHEEPGNGPTLINHLKDRMKEPLVARIAAKLDKPAIFQLHRRFVGDAQRADIALVISTDTARISHLRRIERLAEGERAGHILIDEIGGEIETRLRPVVEAV